MANKGSQFFSRSNRSTSPLPQRSTELLGACQDHLARHLLTYVRPAFEETNDELFDEAHKSGSTEAQNRLFEAMNALKKKRELFSDTLAAEIKKNFEIFVDADPSEDSEQETSAELSLIDDHDLVEDLAITQIVSKAEIRNTQALYALNQRLAVLNRGRAVKNNSNPCGPNGIGAALREAAACLEVTAGDTVRLYHAFDRQLQQHIATCYSELNDKLIEEGILPNLRLDVRKSAPPPVPKPPAEAPPPAEAEAPAEPESGHPQGAQPPPTRYRPAPGPPPSAEHGGARADHGGPPADSGGAPTGTDPGAWQAPPAELDFFGRATSRSIGTATGSRVDAELVRDIRKLLGQVSPPAPGPRNAVIAESPRLQQALSKIQSTLAREESEGVPDLLSADEVKTLLSRSLGRDPGSGKNLALSNQHSQTIDIVGMLYDHIKEEQLLHEPVQQLLKRLQVPMIRVALDEEEFFDDTEHPARRLFNTIADAGELWLDDKPEGSATFNKMQIAVDRILTEYQDDLDVFKELLSDLDKHIATLSRKAKVTERRAVEKLRGQEKLELARDRARSEMERLIEKYEPPRFVESVLEHPWTDFLALTSLRYGVDNDHWKEALAAAKTLIFSVRKNLSEEVKSKLRQRVPWLRKKLTEGLSQVGYFEQDIDIVLDNLETCHRWSLAPPRKQAGTEPERAEPERAEPERAEPTRAEPERAEPERAVRPKPPARRKAGEARREAPAPRESAPDKPEKPAAPAIPAPPEVEAPVAEKPPWMAGEEAAEAGWDAEWGELDLKEVARSGLAEEQRAAPRKAGEATTPAPPAPPAPPSAPEPEVLNKPIPKSAAHKSSHEDMLKKRKAALPQLNSEQKAMLAKIRLLAFGTWFELRLDGEPEQWVKRKLSWYSPLTGRCLFVNNRGAMAEEMNMHELAIAMAEGRAHTYEPQSKPLIDRAFQSIFKRLRGLVDRVAPA